MLPEALLGGDPRGLDLGVPAGSRTADSRGQFRHYFDAARTSPHPQTRAPAALAAELDVCLHLLQEALKS